jgi:hypothetical protein
MRFFAYCWRTGVIEFGSRVPEGARVLDRGGEQSVRRRAEAHARHGYRGELLVPGVPEADTDIAALEACQRFQALLLRQRAKLRSVRGQLLPLFAVGR